MDFENPIFLWFLLFLPILYGVVKKVQTTLQVRMQPWLGTTSASEFKRWQEATRRANFLGLVSIAFILVGLANPRMGQEVLSAKQIKGDVYIAIDISKSMDATDSPPSRMEVVKKKAAALVDVLKGNRIAVLFFAGSSYLAMPLTTDHQAAITMIEASNTDQAGIQGTDISGIAALVADAHQRLGKTEANLIVFTDGEDQENDAASGIKKLTDQGVRTYFIGAGTAEGGTIMLADGPLTDEEGNIVYTKLNERLLKELAQYGNGAYYPITSSNWLEKIKNEVENDTGGKGSVKKIHQPKSYAYISFLFAIVCMLFFAFYFSGGFKASSLKKYGLFITFLLTSILGSTQTHPNFSSGNEKYKNGQFQEAEKYYKEGLKEQDNPAARYNLGNSQYKTDQLEDAIRSYEQAKSALTTSSQQYKLHHNLGNAYFKSGKIKEAIESYKQALRIRPGSKETAINLAKAKQQLAKQKQQQKEENSKDKSSPTENKEDKKSSERGTNQDKKEINSKDKKEKDPGSNKEATSGGKGQKEGEEKKGSWDEKKAMLDFIEREEKKVQQQLRHLDGKGKKTKKPW